MFKYMFLFCLLNFLSVFFKFTEGKNVSTIQALEFERIKGKNEDSITKDNGECSCREFMCGCCQLISIETIHFSENVCANISYLSKEMGVRLTLSINGIVYINEQISVKNPPPFCVGFPEVTSLVSVCLRLTNLNFTVSPLSGCVEFEAEFLNIKIWRIKLGCFKIPISEKKFNGIRVVKENNILHTPETMIDHWANPTGQKKSKMTKEEKLKFIRRFGIDGKTYTGDKIQHIKVGYS